MGRKHGRIVGLVEIICCLVVFSACSRFCVVFFPCKHTKLLQLGICIHGVSWWLAYVHCCLRVNYIKGSWYECFSRSVLQSRVQLTNSTDNTQTGLIIVRCWPNQHYKYPDTQYSSYSYYCWNHTRAETVVDYTHHHTQISSILETAVWGAAVHTCSGLCVKTCRVESRVINTKYHIRINSNVTAATCGAHSDTEGRKSPYDSPQQQHNEDEVFHMYDWDFYPSQTSYNIYCTALHVLLTCFKAHELMAASTLTQQTFVDFHPGWTHTVTLQTVQWYYLNVTWLNA